MTPADVESLARSLERDARGYTRCALHGLDEAERLKRLAEERACDVAREMGIAAGLFFRAAELRYDARGGMTEALERRRFEPGARWLCRGIVFESYGYDVEQPWMVRLQASIFGCIESPDEMTRANGWLFLGLSDCSPPCGPGALSRN
jgi:hypothetical protein